jgi:hypothetical protein
MLRGVAFFIIGIGRSTSELKLVNRSLKLKVFHFEKAS